MSNARGFKYRRTGGYSQDQKALYDIRDNMVTQSDRISRLARAIKQLHGDFKDFSDMCFESGYIPRDKSKREYTLSHSGRNPQSSEILQNNSAKNEGERICKDKNRRRSRMEDIHDKGQSIYGKDVKHEVAYNLAYLHGGNSSSDTSEQSPIKE